jgi:O-antigen ligase
MLRRAQSILQGGRWSIACGLTAAGAFLALGGAARAHEAATLAAIGALLFAARAFAHDPSSIVRWARQDIVPLIAFAAFAVLAIASATFWTPTSAANAWRHPAWAEMGLAYGAPSLAPFRTLEGVAALLAAGFFYGLGALSAQRSGARSFLGHAATYLAIALALIALAGRLASPDPLMRLDLGLPSPNVAATVFATMALLSAAAIVHAGAHRRRGAALLHVLVATPAAAPALALSLACLFMTASRAGLAAAAIGFAVFAILVASARGARRSIVPIALALAPIVVFGAALASDRFAALGGDFAERGALMEAHWQAFLERPWLGHGLNTFHDINAHIATPENWKALSGVGAAHSIYLQALEETGLIGLLLLVAMLAIPLWRTAQRALSDDRRRILAAAVFAALTTALTHGAVDFALQTPAVAALLALVLGALAAKPEAITES